MKHKLVTYALILCFVYCGSRMFFYQDNTMLARRQDVPENIFTVHALDPTFLQHIAQLEKQTNNARKLARNACNTQQLQKVTQIRKKLKNIRRKYTKNSPATAILGPIGTAAIVLKEKKLAEQLYEIAQQVSVIVHSYTQTSTQTDQPTTLIALLQSNEQQLAQLIS